MNICVKIAGQKRWMEAGVVITLKVCWYSSNSKGQWHGLAVQKVMYQRLNVLPRYS